MSFTPKLTIPLLTPIVFAITGCTIASNRCPDGYECIPKNEAGAGTGSGGDGKSGAGEVPGGSAGQGTGGAGAGAGGGGKPGGGGGSGGGTVTPGDPEGEWVHVTSNLSGTPSDCGTIPYVTAKPGEKLIIIGVVKRGVFGSTNDGKSWAQLGDGGDEFTAGLSEVLFDPADSNIWWLAGVRFGSPYRSNDNGASFTKLADFPQNDGISVDFSDPERKTILVGGHEQVQEVQYSDDGGESWTNIGTALPSDSGHSSFPFIVDAKTFMVGTGNSQVYRTTDAGAHWSKVVDSGGGGQALRHSDGSLYWAARETGGIVRSMDDGATWDTVTPGGIVYGMKPIELPDGRIAMRGPMGMLVSDDEGANWRQVAPPVPQDYWWHVTTYDAVGKAFYTTRFTCDTKVVNDDALMRFAWDYTKD
jgi:photosystem II stability/assembly factor-like uncharacterized protein